MQESKTPVPRPSLCGKWIDFYAISPADYPLLYSWRTELGSFRLWSAQSRRVPTYQEFIQSEMPAFTHGCVSMIAVDKAKDIPIGFRRAFNIDTVNGWLWSQTYVHPSYRLKPHAAEAVILFLKYLFDYFPIRKAYSEVYEFDEEIHGMAKRLGYNEEARFREYVWFGDRFWDVSVYALDRATWIKGLERWESTLNISKDLQNLQKVRSPRK